MFALKQQPESAGFWGWFEDNHKRLAETAANLDDIQMDELETVLDELQAAVQDVDDRLFVELSFDSLNGTTLVITADGELDAMASARELVEMAPDMDGWAFEALRARDDPGDTFELPGGGAIDTREAVFVLEVNDGKAEIAVGISEWEEARGEDFNLAAQHLVESTLGEADYAAGVSGVMALSTSDLEQEADPWPLKALATEFDKHLGA